MSGNTVRRFEPAPGSPNEYISVEQNFARRLNHYMQPDDKRGRDEGKEGE